MITLGKRTRPAQGGWGSGGAHQIVNTGPRELRTLALSTLSEVDVGEYPDSDKLLVVAGEGDGGLRNIFQAEATVECYDREAGWE
ncbi:MAG: hypothetical protein DI549_17370 [Ancylobacter novellus]|uniref:Uncharacterized protein n=1 Tax=Ancylobacter novellus TaxID=921 RepID=A0A2W5QVV4_ANCNO|nr:MAG: hypothetical protein DI549_17370 [Ancylobacter novellus]